MSNQQGLWNGHGMKLKTPQELAQMSKKELRDYRTILYLLIHEKWGRAQREAWAPILRAIERSNENKAALVLKSGSVTRAIVMVEFWQDDQPGTAFEHALVRLSVDRRDGSPVEEYAPNPEELMAYLERLGLDPYAKPGRWEPV